MKIKGKINNFEFDFEGDINDFIQILNNLPQNNIIHYPSPEKTDYPVYPSDPLYPNDPWYPHGPITICKNNKETYTGDSTSEEKI